jgi:hypothetical protein
MKNKHSKTIAIASIELANIMGRSASQKASKTPVAIVVLPLPVDALWRFWFMFSAGGKVT